MVFGGGLRGAAASFCDLWAILRGTLGAAA